MTDIFNKFAKQWAIVAAGNMERHNAMTIGWGGMGTLWSKPVVTVYVKPCRHTYSYLNDNEYFTVSFYPEDCRKALGVMGTLSGRDCDKEAKAGLTAEEFGPSITFEEAELSILCKKIYFQDLDIEKIPAELVDHYYQSEAPHRMFVGEVIEIREK